MNVLILGTSAASIDVLESCRRLGFETFAISKNLNDAAQEYAEHFRQIDYTDKEKIHELCLGYKIDLIYSIGTDKALLTIAELSETLGLPCFINKHIVEITVDKEKRRKAMGKDYPYGLEYKVMQDKEEILDWNLFPCIIKPIDNQGQVGVFYAGNRDKLAEYFPLSLKNSFSKRVIIEEFINGPDISVVIYLMEGEVRFFQTIEMNVLPYSRNMVVDNYRVPCRHYVTSNKIHDIIADIVNKVGIRNGPLLLQLRMDNDTPKIIEFVPRLGGGWSWKLAWHYTGVNLLDINLKHLAGHSSFSFKKNISDNFILLKFILAKNNDTIRITEEAFIDSFEHLVIEPDGNIAKSNNDFKRVAYFMYKG